MMNDEGRIMNDDRAKFQIKKNFLVSLGVVLALLLGAYFLAYRSGVSLSPKLEHGGAVSEKAAVPMASPTTTSTAESDMVATPMNLEDSTSSPQGASSSFAKVTRVLDGDTIEIAGGEYVRYIGMDAPEEWYSKKATTTNTCYAVEAKQENEQLVLGKTVRLEEDVRNRDVYGRLLRYVYVTPEAGGSKLDATTSSENFVNEELVQEGFAKAAPYPPDIKYKTAFSELEKYARDNKKGLWGACE